MEVTIKELNELCTNMYELKAEALALSDQAKEKNKAVAVLQAKILDLFEEHDMTSHAGPFGKVIKTKRYSVKKPTTPEDKQAFYGYLKEQGIFEDMISVHSSTLQSYVKQEIEAMESEGRLGWKPPGINDVGTTNTISMRKK